MSTEFVVFLDSEKGPSWRAAFADLDEAEHAAQKLATAEGAESFVYSLKHFYEVERFFPADRRAFLAQN
jgi:hypothetical protein